jgi:multicomponent Na+:H+ antiporter subunit D
LSIVIGALAALQQKDLRRILAYSSISQIGYIILAFGCATPLAIAGAIFHFFNHAIAKSLLFLNAASIEQATGQKDIKKMGGLSGRMPVANAACLVGSLSVVGVPPLSGFWSKLLIIMALYLSGQVFYAVLALFASLLTLAYFLNMQRHVFWGQKNPLLAQVSEKSWELNLGQILFVLLNVGIGIVFLFWLGIMVAR